MDKRIVSTEETGNRFKRDNIYLATVKLNAEGMREGFRKVIENNAKAAGKSVDTEKLNEVVKNLLGLGNVEATEHDIFYKDDRGYTRYTMGVPDTFKSEDSDSRGTLINIVLAWDYYDVSEIKEATLENGDVILTALAEEPLNRYIKDCNKKRLNQGK